MGRVLYLVQTKLLQLHETPRVFISEKFMMVLFTELEDCLSLLKEYRQHLYCKRNMKVVGRKIGATVMVLAKSKYLIFHPENATIISCMTRIIYLVPVCSHVILAEFDNKKRTSYWNLLISD